MANDWTVAELVSATARQFTTAGYEARAEGGDELHIGAVVFVFRQHRRWRSGNRSLTVDWAPIRNPGSSTAPARIAEHVLRVMPQKLAALAARTAEEKAELKRKAAEPLFSLAGFRRDGEYWLFDADRSLYGGAAALAVLRADGASPQTVRLVAAFVRGEDVVLPLLDSVEDDGLTELRSALSFLAEV